MSYWWESRPEERYWCEITDRLDLGADLKCPETDEAGRDYWSYSLIKQVESGDIVFHYSTRQKAYVGASVAGTPVEERAIVWSPHGTVGRGKAETRVSRPGWWLPLYGFVEASPPLFLAELQEPGEQTWIRTWLTDAKKHGTTAAPLQPYPGQLRATQGYLTKMPLAFVDRWPKLRALDEKLEGIQSKLATLSQQVVPFGKDEGSFNPKNASDYVVLLTGGLQRRTRSHEALVKFAGEVLQSAGAKVATTHPLDLLVKQPLEIIIEAKTIRGRPPGFAIREAVGQLYEYRHFLGPKDAQLCILLDKEPDRDFVTYVEDVLHIMMLWKQGDALGAGPMTLTTLADARIRLFTTGRPPV